MSHALHTALITKLNTTATLPLAAAVAIKFAVVLTQWVTRRKTRQTLKHLEPHLLRDIGLDHGSAQAEAAKPFWQD